MMNKLFKIYISSMLILLCASALNENDGMSTTSFILPGSVVGASNKDLTNIIVVKDIMPTNNKNSPDIKLTVTMPPRPAKMDIVLAMDTSGSMVQSYVDDPSKTQIQWATEALELVVSHYPEARVSIVSWDDEDETNDLMTRFYNISTESTLIKSELEKLHSECYETDHTVYSIGIKRAISVLDQYPPLDPYNTARIIIFVTGLSEFRAEPKDPIDELTLNYQLKNAIRNRDYNKDRSFDGYQIFPVQIGIDQKLFKLEYKNLTKIMNYTKIRNRPFRNDPYSEKELNELSASIDEILNGLRSRPLAEDVEVIDTLYPYLEYLGSENSEKIPVNKTDNLVDGTTTLHWKLGNMNSTDTWWALIHSRLMLKLPVEVSNEKTEVGYYISNTTPVSKIRYTWLTGYRGELSLPEGEIKFPS